MTDTDLDYEELGESFAKTAEELAEQFQNDIDAPESPTVRDHPVLSAKSTQNKLELIILTNSSKTETVSIPWPDDMEDMSEPLVRLAKKQDVPIQDITQLRKVPIYTDGETYELVVPPEPSNLRRKLFLRLPTGVTQYTVSDGFNMFNTPISATPNWNIRALSSFVQIALAVGLFISLFGLSPSVEPLRGTLSVHLGLAWITVLCIGVLGISGTRSLIKAGAELLNNKYL